MSGQVSFTYIPPNLRIPLFSVEFNNSQAGANQDIQRAVLLGGTLITQPVAAVYVATVAEAIALFGASSMLARMMAAYRANDPFGEVWCLPIPDPAAGAAATVPVTITGAATGPGTMALYVGGQLVQAGVTSGMTATQVATATALAVNAVGLRAPSPACWMPGAHHVPARNNAVAGVADKSGAGNVLAAFRVSGSTLPQATPRLNGLLGGVGLNTIVPPAMPQSGEYLPRMDGDSGLRLASANLGAATGWTWYLVWSRPNWRQGSTGAISLLTAGGVTVLGADAIRGAGDRLILLPGAGQVVLTSVPARRHTHSIVIRNTPGSGVDVWLDGAQVATGAANPLVAGGGSLLFLHSGQGQGGAQCWFHEAASWPRALAAGDITTLLACATRWKRGPRKGVILLITGQSNASYYALIDGAAHLLAQGVAWPGTLARWDTTCSPRMAC